MKKYLGALLVVALLGCADAGESGEKNATPVTDTIVIDADSVKNPKADGTAIDAAVLDTTVRKP